MPIDWEGLDDELISQGKDPKFYNPDGARKDKGPDGVPIDWETIQQEQEIKQQQQEGPSERHIAVNGQLQVAQDNINSLGARINYVQAELSRRQSEYLPPGVIDIYAKVEKTRLKTLQKEREEWLLYRTSLL